VNLGLVAGVLLGVVFCVAAGTKLTRGPAWVADAAALGGPRVLYPLVPWIELVLGALLVVRVAPVAVAAGAVAVLAAFTALLAANLARGRRPVCACFGEWSRRPLGALHVARNLVLIALAVVVLLDGL
jgi:uncharacterized membrane protein YphA (DoxX/SURF4 family)